MNASRPHAFPPISIRGRPSRWTAIEAMVSLRVCDLETLAARTGMSEMLIRAHLHRAALGDAGAADAARLFAERIDNPAVLARVSAS